jgi:hypothetical protein
VGWTGSIGVRLWDDCHNFIVKEGEDRYSIHAPYLTITRIVEWNKVNARSGEKERIQNSYYETCMPKPPNPGRRKEKTGNSRKKMASVIQNPAARQRPAVSQKEARILPSGWAFWYHVLLAREPYPPDPDTWLPILEFRAHRLFLALGEAIGAKPYSSDCVTAGLVDKSGSTVGTLLVNSTNSEDIQSGLQCELIAISKREKQTGWRTGNYTIRRHFPEAALLHKNCTATCEFGGCKGEKLYRFYSVLWIEWENGIAYGKALGSVYQSFWDRQKVEEVEIRLG